MTQDEFNEARDAMIADQDKWRDKYAVWLSTYYGGLLASVSLIAAIAQFIKPTCPSLAFLPKFISVLCVTCAAIVILRIRAIIGLYRPLGFDRLPDNPEQIEKYYWRTKQTKERNDSLAWLHVFYERAAFVIPVIIFAFFALLVCL